MRGDLHDHLARALFPMIYRGLLASREVDEEDCLLVGVRLCFEWMNTFAGPPLEACAGMDHVLEDFRRECGLTAEAISRAGLMCYILSLSHTSWSLYTVFPYDGNEPVPVRIAYCGKGYAVTARTPGIVRDVDALVPEIRGLIREQRAAARKQYMVTRIRRAASTAAGERRRKP